jgi:hypothetical protein
MRSGQHNKRGRNRHRGGGGGGGGGNNGGNPLNRVYESNGPDVKVRGTAQTIADKYLQLGRDAQSSGDSVMAESYYQFAEHYLRIVSAAQAYQQQNQQNFRRPGEDRDDDEEGGEDGEAQVTEARASPPADEQPDVVGEEPFEGDRQPQPNFRAQRDGRDSYYGNRDRDQNNYNRDGGYRDGNRDRDRNRQRFQDRRDVAQPSGELRTNASAAETAGSQKSEQPSSSGGEWEAPSFLRRPAPAAAVEAADAGPSDGDANPPAERKPRGSRAGRRDRSPADAEGNSSE